jgi:Leucine-rich repeat (LRR) protein
MKQLLFLPAGVGLMGCSTDALPPEEEKGYAPNTPNEEAKSPETSKTTAARLVANPVVEKAICRALQKPSDELTEADLKKVTELDLRSNELKDVAGLERLTRVVRLHFGHNQLTNLTGLEKLTQLKELSLSYNNLTVIPKGLENLTQLEVLYLDDNALVDLTGLRNLKQLEQLSLKTNPDITKAQIAELQKSLSQCRIFSNPIK